MSDARRVLMCSFRDLAHPGAGGAEVYTHEVLRRWAGQGHDVTLFSAGVDGEPLESEADGYRIVRGGSRAGVYRAARNFHRRSPNFDLVIDQVNTRPFFCHEWARGNEKTVCLIHQVAREIWFEQTSLPVAMLGRYIVEPGWLRRLRQVPAIAVSDSTADSLRNYGMQRVVTVLSSLEPVPKEAPIERTGPPTIVFVGRLVANKQPVHVVQAFERVRAHMPDARLWIIGGGSLERRVRRRAGPGVEVFGRVDESTKERLLSEADVLVATSVREGWGLVVDEAAERGTAVIAYDAPGLRDSVGRANGVLVEPRPEALAEALLAHLTAKAERNLERRLGKWDWQALADRLWDAAVDIAEPPRGSVAV
ncbi:MAG: glycosyltransferase involved in cell wall biosynthesis [Candidatus Poriferisodalaceae bacterium]|jgi:glycosyltransferase involved in cell wall biosynthesis